jgi:transposase
MADWLLACGVDTVALESTGVYWIPVYEVLERRGLTVWLVDTRQMKYVPGRKSDRRIGRYAARDAAAHADGLQQPNCVFAEI